jgi:hypothetical protein
MSHFALPRIFQSSAHGAPVTDREPSVLKLLLLFVIPMSLLPPLMYVYAQIAHPGVILPRLEPDLNFGEAMIVGSAFFVIEILAVFMMAKFIQHMGDDIGVQPDYADAFALAATAPTPLWLATLALALPNAIVNVVFLALAWFCCVGLIRRGVQTLFMPHDDSHTHELANTLTFIGVSTWFSLLLFLVLILSMVIGWR